MLYCSFSDLIKCSSEPNVSIPQLADLVIERTQHPNWVVVFKAIISLHGMMNFGNEVRLKVFSLGDLFMMSLRLYFQRFCQYMASNNCTINVENFSDKSGTLGKKHLFNKLTIVSKSMIVTYPKRFMDFDISLKSILLNIQFLLNFT